MADAALAAGTINAVGFCYRFAPAVQHARALIEAGAIGEVNHYRGVFLADYANRPDAAASWRFLRADAGSGALGDLMAHIVDMTHFLVGPIERLSGRTATMIPRRPPLPIGEGTHFSRVATDDLVDVENEDWAAALVELDGGTVGSLEASRVIVGPHVRMRFEAHGTAGALAWELERMNELQRFELAENGRDEGYMTVLRRARSIRASRPSSPARACRWATTTCACSRRPLPRRDPRRRAARAGPGGDARRPRACSTRSSAPPAAASWEPAR